MKKIIYPLSISIIGGIVALLIHNLNFDHNLSSKNIFPENKMVNISFDPNSISESSTNIDFTVAAEKTINSGDVINMALLKKLKLINKNSQKLKILGTGEIKDKVNIEADLISKSAVEKLEKAGGTIQLKK